VPTQTAQMRCHQLAAVKGNIGKTVGNA
jgi:hypothetical protein